MNDFNVKERMAYLTRIILIGGELSASDIETLTGVSRRTAQRDIVHLERVLPIVRNESGKLKILDS